MGLGVRSLAVLVLGLVPSWAGAAPEPKTVLVLPLEHPGLPEEVVRTLDQAMRSEVQKNLSRNTLLPAPKLDFQEMRLAAGCADDGVGCLSTIGKELGAGRVIRMQLVGSAKKASLKLTILRVQNGKTDTPTPAEIRELDADSAAELRYHVARALGGKPPLPQGSLTLAVGGRDPSMDGAEYFLDDEKVPAKSLQKVQPGDHRLSVHRPGYESLIWMGEVLPGKDTQVKIEWKASNLVTPPPPVVAVTPPPPDSPPIARATPPPPLTLPPTQAPPPALVTEAPPPRLLFTWVFATGTLVAAATWGVMGAQVLDRENQVVEKGYDCQSGDRDLDICSGGRKLATFTNIAIAATGTLLVGTVAAFFLEDGPTVLFGPEPTARAGIGPTDDGRGLAAAVSVRF